MPVNACSTQINALPDDLGNVQTGMICIVAPLQLLCKPTMHDPSPQKPKLHVDDESEVLPGGNTPSRTAVPTGVMTMTVSLQIQGIVEKNLQQPDSKGKCWAMLHFLLNAITMKSHCF